MTDEQHSEQSYEPDTGALRALAHPLRIEIYDLISQHGPQTSSSLAEHTGESTGSTSYHLRALAKHGLIKEVPGRGSGRERWWERAHHSIALATEEALQTPAGRAASQVVNLEFIDRRHRQLREYISATLRSGFDDWARSLNIHSATIPLTLPQLQQMQAELTAVLDSYTSQYRDQEGEGVRRISVQTSAFPITESRH